jgi:hypothetical protein
MFEVPFAVFKGDRVERVLYPVNQSIERAGGGFPEARFYL